MHPCDERLPQFFNGVEALDPKQLFFERANKAFGAAIALWLPHEAGAGFDAEKSDFFLIHIADKLAAILSQAGRKVRLRE
jgi:hypothetical protein